MSEQWLPSASDQEDMQGPTVDELQATIEQLGRELEQVRVQIAGCLTAAEGSTTDVAKRGDYGWTPAYQATLDLRRRYDRVIETMKKIRPMLLSNDAVAKHGGAFSDQCPVCVINQVVELDPPHIDAGRRT